MWDFKVSQRPIKFKVWDSVSKKIYNVWNFCNGYDGDLLSVSTIDETGITTLHFPQDRCALMQFTGFHDKNGKEIYEGDLMKHNNVSELLEVYWCDATGQWKLGYGEHRHYYGCLYLYPNNLLEVVGNVYETER